MKITRPKNANKNKNYTVSCSDPCFRIPPTKIFFGNCYIIKKKKLKNYIEKDAINMIETREVGRCISP